MKDEIQQIRNLLEKIEKQSAPTELSVSSDFQMFELPEFILGIVEYLQPLLRPYPAAIYWYLFSHSFLQTGKPYIRVSTRGLGQPKTVVASASGQSDGLSYRTVQDSLTALEEFGAIRKEGDPNREGTLYRVFLPEEIDACLDLMKEKAESNLPAIVESEEVDYYNVRENRHKVFERDGYKCHYCGRQLTRFSATLDHIQPVSKGGLNTYDNLTTACLHCNSQKTNKEVMDAIIKGDKDTHFA